MKLEEGMYVRTDLGNIGKIVEEYTHQNNKVSYPEPQEWVLDTGFILNEAVMYKNEEIIKASHNIIDLIEVGDYVNSKKVGYIDDCEGAMREYYYDYENASVDAGHWFEEIQTIVTKEQMEQMSYRIGD